MVRTARALLAVAVAGLCSLLGLLLPSPAAAAEPVASVAITLTSMEPQLPTRDGEITVTGRVTNITKQRLYRLEALFWRNQAPISGRAGLEQALASESNDPLGARHTGAFQDLFTAAEPFLAPNASVDFRLKAKISDLELSPTDGVYLMGVHVLQRGNNVAIGRARTFVPVVAAKPKNSLTMTSLVIMNTRPSLVRKGVLFDDHLAAEVGQNGRLTALLKAAEPPPRASPWTPRWSRSSRPWQPATRCWIRRARRRRAPAKPMPPDGLRASRDFGPRTTATGCCTAHLISPHWCTTARRVCSVMRQTPTSWWS